VIRLQMLMTHYRQPLDWTLQSSQLAMNELEDWASALQGVYRFPNTHSPEQVVNSLADDLNTPDAIATLRELYAAAKRGGVEEEQIFAANCKFLGFRHLDKPGFFRFGVSAMNVGAQRLFEFEKPVQRLRAASANTAPQSTIDEIVKPIRSAGLDIDVSKSGDITLIRGNKFEFERRVEELLAARAQARKDRDFAESDRIRAELAEMGVVLKDKKDGTTWEIAQWWGKPPLVLVHDTVQRLIKERTEARKAKNFERVDQISQELKSLGFDLADNNDGSTNPKER
jgi:cysteinyl-tRNA synthetase